MVSSVVSLIFSEITHHVKQVKVTIFSSVGCALNPRTSKMAAFGNDASESKSWFDYIKLTPQKEWNYDYLSENPNITWDIVLANPDKAWNYACLSMNPNITWDIVSANPD